MILRITFFLLILSVFHQTFSQTKNIIVFGDSISAAYGIDSSKGWVNILRERLADNTEDVTIINASVSGETSKGGVARINSVLQKHKPKILILELGGNDGLRGYPISDISSNLETIISTSLSQNTRVVIMGMIIPPNYGIRYSSAFSAIFPKLASKYQLQYIPIQLEGTLTDKTLFTTTTSPLIPPFCVDTLPPTPNTLSSFLNGINILSDSSPLIQVGTLTLSATSLS